MKISLFPQADEDLADDLTNEYVPSPVVKVSNGLIKNMGNSPFKWKKKANTTDLIGFNYLSKDRDRFLSVGLNPQTDSLSENHERKVAKCMHLGDDSSLKRGWSQGLNTRKMSSPKSDLKNDISTLLRKAIHIRKNSWNNKEEAYKESKPSWRMTKTHTLPTKQKRKSDQLTEPKGLSGFHPKMIGDKAEESRHDNWDSKSEKVGQALGLTISMKDVEKAPELN